MTEDAFKRKMLKLVYDRFPYKDMSNMLHNEFGIMLSPDAIRKRLKRLGYPSRKGQTSLSVINLRTEIQHILPDRPRTTGYRMMTSLLREKGYHVRRDQVMHVMREADPDGVQYRRRRRLFRRVYRSKGPNHTWHIDGFQHCYCQDVIKYDKLKPWGFAIHGAIDGYSRRILWLRVGPSNNDPRITAYYYWKCVRSLKGCPLILQADPGTENVITGAMQCFFRHSGDDIFAGTGSLRITRSTFNQRIEAWWSILRKQVGEWWIQFFRDLEAFGGVSRGNETDMLCIRSCFMSLLQNELNSFVRQWNCHHIATSREAVCPNGRPDVLFYTPETTGGHDCIQEVSEEDHNWTLSQCASPTTSGSVEFDDFVNEVRRS